MSVIPCMGGWCRQRESCAHYVAPVVFSRQPAERLCERGKEEPEPIKQSEGAKS